MTVHLKEPGELPASNIPEKVLAAMQQEVMAWVKEKGWLDDRSFGDSIALLISEPIEALEAFRTHGFDEWFTYQPVINGVKMPKMTQEQCEALGIDVSELQPRREGVAAEFAGTLVRLMDDAGRLGINLFEEWRREMDYNWTRTYRHGGKAL